MLCLRTAKRSGTHKSTHAVNMPSTGSWTSRSSNKHFEKTIPAANVKRNKCVTLDLIWYRLTSRKSHLEPVALAFWWLGFPLRQKSARNMVVSMPLTYSEHQLTLKVRRVFEKIQSTKPDIGGVSTEWLYCAAARTFKSQGASRYHLNLRVNMCALEGSSSWTRMSVSLAARSHGSWS